MTAEHPTMGEVLLMKGDNWLDMPDVNSPYYILAQEGRFIHRRTAQGRGIVPTFKLPNKMPKIGFPNGYFKFDGEILPAEIYAQAVHFFRRIFAKHNTEAEVIITQNQNTKAYRLFIPHQSVSHGGVRSIYNPAHIARDHMVIGTFHSHCDFGAGHSGIDEGDARDMDGLHGTIGMIHQPEPEMALMYALNQKFFHFSPPFDGVIDTTNLEAATAPEWWDRYVLTTSPTDADRDTIAPYADDDTWDKFMGRYKPKTPIVTEHKTWQPAPGQTTPYRQLTDTERRSLSRWAGDWPNPDSEEEYDHQLISESIEFNNRLHNLGWNKDGELVHSNHLDDMQDSIEEYWETVLGDDYINDLFGTQLLNEDDLNDALEHPSASDPLYWEAVMRVKLMRSVSWLRQQGYNVSVKVIDARPKQLPGQTTMEQYEGGLL